jgi:hypothetical protein
MPKVIKTKTEFEGRILEEYVVVEGEGAGALGASSCPQIRGQKHAQN